MFLKFLIALTENMKRDFRKDSRLDKKSNFNNKSFGNDYLIRKEEYGKNTSYLIAIMLNSNYIKLFIKIRITFIIKFETSL